MPRRREVAAVAASLLLLPADAARPGPFDGGDWRLVSVRKDGRTEQVPAGWRAFFRVDRSGAYAAKICNGHSGTARPFGPFVELSFDSSTLMGCGGSLGLAQAVFGELNARPTTLWWRRGDTLTLRWFDRALTFVADPSPPPRPGAVVVRSGRGDAHEHRFTVGSYGGTRWAIWDVRRGAGTPWWLWAERVSAESAEGARGIVPVVVPGIVPDRLLLGGLAPAGTARVVHMPKSSDAPATDLELTGVAGGVAFDGTVPVDAGAGQLVAYDPEGGVLARVATSTAGTDGRDGPRDV
jgi:hypothetical protein